jgi:Na+-driven multidrug efflux pump
MNVGVSSMWIVRIGFGVVISKYMNIGMFGVWIAMIIDWVVRSIFFTLRYKSHKWEVKAR